MSDASNSVVCPACGGKDLYVTAKPIQGGGGYAPDLLPGLHPWFQPGSFRVVLFADFGLLLLFADPEARPAVRSSAKSKRPRSWLLLPTSHLL